jgi:hypothetical protein
MFPISLLSLPSLPEPEFLDVVLGLHRYFCTSSELLQKLLAVLNSLKGGIAPWQHDIRIAYGEKMEGREAVKRGER